MPQLCSALRVLGRHTVMKSAVARTRRHTSPHTRLFSVPLPTARDDVNATDANSETALHGTGYRGLIGSNTIIRLLVDQGAKLNVKNTSGWTPLAIAEGIYFGGSDSRSDQSAALFRSLGAEPTPADVDRGGNVAHLKARNNKQTSR